MKKKIVLVFVFLCTILCLISCKENNHITKLRFGTFDFGDKIDPFFYDDTKNNTMLDLTFSRLFGTDYEGNIIYDIAEKTGRDIDGFRVYSPCSMSLSVEDSIYTYTITIKDGIYSSNGHEFDSKDLLFDLYVHLDPSNTNSKLNTLPIIGLDEYKETHENKKDDVDYIEGITYTSHSISVSTNRILTDEEKSYLNIYMVPYSFLSTGVKLLPDNHKFGVEKNNLTKIKSTNYYSKGTGEYYLKEMSIDKYVFMSNSAFYKGKITITTLEFHRLKPFVYDEDMLIESGGDEYYSIDKNKIDFAIVSYDEKSIDEVKRYNLNGKEEGNILYLLKINGTENALVCSTKRMNKESVLSLNINENHSFFELLYLYR